MQAGDDLSDVGSGDDKIGFRGELFLRPLAQSRAFVIAVEEPSVGRVGKVQLPKEAKGGACCADAAGGEFFCKKTIEQSEFVWEFQLSEDAQQQRKLGCVHGVRPWVESLFFSVGNQCFLPVICSVGALQGCGRIFRCCDRNSVFR